MRQTVLAIFFMFFINSGWSFVLLGTSAPPRYPSGHIAVKIVNDHTCANITLSAEELRALTQEAVDDFWNTVHTSSLYLDVQGYVSSNGRDINDFLGAANNNIVVGCSTDTQINNSSIIAVGGYSYNSNILKGYVAINDNSGTPFNNLSRRDQVATLAHEIGHALGIGHSEKEFALMYYSTGAVYNYLSQDDADAITYLYPHDGVLGGLGGNCSSIKDQNKKGPLGLFMGLLLVLLAKEFHIRFCRHLVGVS
ncbi:MAG: matrixin family metalloprotease [Bdellovibrionota bacterium]|nr:matrixin family metalloprotease [Bdellovibrionota bacterium]